MIDLIRYVIMLFSMLNENVYLSALIDSWNVKTKPKYISTFQRWSDMAVICSECEHKIQMP